MEPIRPPCLLALYKSFLEIEKGSYHFKGPIPCDSAGLHGFAIRILPYHKNMVTPYIPGLIFWG
ncbi:MAG: hypothetical protein OEY64_01070 [Nitrospinota bacterium]|nr:hypothetical protein [Nitrospinota bacterium]